MTFYDNPFGYSIATFNKLLASSINFFIQPKSTLTVIADVAGLR